MREVFDKIKQRLEEQKRSCFLTLANKGDSEKDYAYKIVAKSLERAIEIVDEVAEDYNNGWIPCSERLPVQDEKAEYYQSVIVTLDDGRVAEGCYRSIDKEWWVDAPDGEHYSEDMTGRVIAWQPLPASYKKEV